MKATIVAAGVEGLRFSELKTIEASFKKAELFLAEFAFDFSIGHRVDREFVERYATFGKCRLRTVEPHLTFGSRHGAKLVRCYQKPELDVFRIELQLQRPWLKRRNIEHIDQLACVPLLILQGHFQFARLSEEKLRNHLSRRGVPVSDVLHSVRRRSHSLSSALSYLRKDVSLVNVHRLLGPIKANRAVRTAAQSWVRNWSNL